jgi:multidrug transporter EmrE-like cation transporter
MINYILVILSCLLSASQMGFSKAYSAKYGDGMRAVYRCSTLSGIAFVVIMGIKDLITKNPFEMTGFSFVIAMVFALINAVCIIFLFGGFKHGEVSRVILFTNLGSLMIPTIFGFFIGEGVTVGKIICLVLITASLFTSINFKTKGGSNKAILYYAVIFIMNGLAGITMAIHQKRIGGFAITNEDDLTTMVMLLYAIMCLCVLGYLYGFMPVKEEDTKKIDNLPLCIGLSAGNGLLYGVATLLSAVALAAIPASVQYPLLTGGGVVLGGLVGRVFGEKIDVKFLISCVLVLAGTIALGIPAIN